MENPIDERTPVSIPDLIIPQEGNTVEIPLEEELSIDDFTVPSGTRIQCNLAAGPRRGRWTGLNWIFEVAIRLRRHEAPNIIWITAVTPGVWERVEP